MTNSITQLIGNTPLLKAERYGALKGLKNAPFVKLEKFNPAGSVKDRAALYMIKDALQSGRLKKGGTIVEPTSGNTGIALAAIAAAFDMKVILTMPDSMSRERIAWMNAYGAEIVLTPGALGMKGAIEKAEEIVKENDGALMPMQFENAANARAHYETTGPEIWRQSGGKVDIFVAGVGTGGTISGVGKFLKEKNPAVKIVAVEPKDSPLLSGGKAGGHPIQGIGANFIPKLLDRSVIDFVYDCEGENAFLQMRDFALSEGITVGISSGAALAAAIGYCAEYPQANIVVILPDGGEKYMSLMG